jgi:gamma-glutamyltranspeptidase/glutathione hydrolase
MRRKALAILLWPLVGSVVIAVILLSLPRGPREILEFDDPHRRPRESVSADLYMAVTGTPWATRAAVDILEKGGNAFDAGMAALLALNVTYPEAASFPSVAPTMIFDAETGGVRSYCGAGTAPRRATIEHFESEGYETIPQLGILAQLIPASPDALVSILDRYGTLGFSELSAAGIRLAAEGFPVHSMMIEHFDPSVVERIGYNFLMPYNVDVYLEGQWWRPLRHKDRFRQPDLAGTLAAMADAERRALEAGATRSAALKAVRDYFYEGPIADAIAEMHAEQGGLMTKQDLANYSGYWEEPHTGRFGEYTIHANGTWSQGAVTPMALQILDGIDLAAMGRETPEYVHAVIQALELAMADREAYFGDPDFVEVPVQGLLGADHAARRRQLMTPGRAFGEMPPTRNVIGDRAPS